MSYVIQFVLNGTPYRYLGLKRGFAPDVPGWVYEDKTAAVATMGALRRSSIFAPGAEFVGCGGALHLADPATGKRLPSDLWAEVTEVQRRQLEAAKYAESRVQRLAEWRANRNARGGEDV